MPPLIRLRGVTKVYGAGRTAVMALKGIDIDIMAGEFVAVMGPSDSGKSTAVNVLGCLDTPTSGTYLFRGVHVESLSQHERQLLRRRYCGFISQGFNLLPGMSAQHTVELPLLFRGESAATRRAMVREALVSVGLEGHEHHTSAELSGGQQQRVAVARALVKRPALLLADEPTRNLDTQHSRELMELLWRLNVARGITVLVVTRDPEVAACCKRLVRFMNGAIESDDLNARPTLLQQPAQLIDACGGPQQRSQIHVAKLFARFGALRRSFLTGLGIVMGVSAVITMLTIAIPGAVQGARFTKMIARRHEIGGVQVVAPEPTRAVTVVADGENRSTTVSGTTDAWFEARDCSPRAG